MILKDLYQEIKARFQKANVDTFALDARILICHVLQITHEQFVLQNERVLNGNELTAINDLVSQRLEGRPVAKIIGYKEFYGRRFITSDNTLDPRPDSEVLIETVLPHLPEKAHILDLGTGTGCLALTLLCEKHKAQAIGIDQSRDALEVARRNSWALGVEDRVVFVESDWFSAVIGTFDLIISNPPYIPEDDIEGLAVEVRRFDPMAALVGGKDGMDPYRILVPQMGRFLKPGGMAAFEVGQGQAETIAEWLKEAGFSDIRIIPDLGGIQRVVVGIWLQNTTKPL